MPGNGTKLETEIQKCTNKCGSLPVSSKEWESIVVSLLKTHTQTKPPTPSFLGIRTHCLVESVYQVKPAQRQLPMLRNDGMADESRRGEEGFCVQKIPSLQWLWGICTKNMIALQAEIHKGLIPEPGMSSGLGWIKKGRGVPSFLDWFQGLWLSSRNSGNPRTSLSRSGGYYSINGYVSQACSNCDSPY